MPLDIGAISSNTAKTGFSFYLPDMPDMKMPIVFEAGMPDPATFPIEDLSRLYAEVLREHGDELMYGTPMDGDLSYGSVTLRDQLIARTKVIDGKEIERNGVMLVGGGVQGISLAAQAFLDPGDVAAIECPSWEFILRDVTVAGAEALPIPIDDDGLLVDRLEEEIGRLAREGKRLKLLYTIPTFNVPTGVCMSLERRRKLVGLAAEHGFMIIEDNVYGDLRYDGDSLPTLFSLDEAGAVIKIDSFSKTLIPALRMAWVTGHSAAISTLDRVRRDLGVSQLTARVLGRFMAEGRFDTHIANACELYRSKRDVALAGLEEYCTPWVTTNRPDGGYFLWMRLADDVDAGAVQGKAFAEGVMCRPGERFFGADVLDGEYLRLAFTTPTVADLQRAVEVLGKAASDSVR